MSKQVFSTDFYGKNLTVEVGELAKQANGSVLERYDDTVILSTAVAGKEPKSVDFFPLTVTYEEKLYSVGKIPGGFLKREGRPSEHGTLTARMIDRPIRPLFADGFRNEVQVVNTVLSVDQQAFPEMAAMLGASLALCVSDIPFNGPIAGVNVGLIDGEFTINAGPEEMERSLINLEVAGTKDAINMVEADAKEVDEDTMLNALMFGHEAIKELIAFEEKVVEACGKEKIEIPLFELDEALVQEITDLCNDEMVAAVSIPGKLERYAAIDEIMDRVTAQYDEKEYAAYLKRLQIQDELRSCVNDNYKGFELFYQPIVNVATGKIIGAEALIRWNSEKYGFMSPVDFIPLLEESSLIIPLGRWIVDTAAEFCSRCIDIIPDFVMHVNLSFVQIIKSDVKKDVLENISRHKAANNHYVLEITESIQMDSNIAVKRVLDDFVSNGFLLAIDDFGTGYSNFEYMKDRMFGILKVDRSFVTDIHNNDNNSILVGFIIKMAHEL